LLPGSALTPSLVESLVRLGATVPFAQAADLLAHFTGVRVGAETVRRLTEAAGAVQVTIETTAVADLERTLPAAPEGPAVQLLSVDGAMAPRVGGEWGEVKTLALGEVVATDDGPHTTGLSYFSRLTNATTFSRLSTVETHRQGTATAATVVAVSDGAIWCQGFIDWQCPDAVRVLDFPHAVEHLAGAAQAALGAGTAATSAWLGEQVHRLRHGAEDDALAALAALLETPGMSAEAGTLIRETQTYLATRRAHIRYATFVAAGYPIGSGCVESANKLVVEARLKGAGMHWARHNVDPLLALRCLIANGRWVEAWPVLWRRLCTTRRAPRPAQAAARPTACPGPSSVSTPPSPPVPLATQPAPRPKLVIKASPPLDARSRRSCKIRSHTPRPRAIAFQTRQIWSGTANWTG